jgi:hypothetical protein
LSENFALICNGISTNNRLTITIAGKNVEKMVFLHIVHGKQNDTDVLVNSLAMKLVLTN